MTEATYESFEEDLRPVSKEVAESQLTTLASEMFQCNAEVERITGLLVQASDRLRDVKEKRLPRMMQTLNMDTFSYTDGAGQRWTVKHEKTLFASMPKDVTTPEQRAEVFKWVEDLGQGGAIRHDFIAALGTADPALLVQIEAAVKAVAPTVSTKVEHDIHHSTLSAIVRRAVDDGKKVPMGIKQTPKDEASCKMVVSRPRK